MNTLAILPCFVIFIYNRLYKINSFIIWIFQQLSSSLRLTADLFTFFYFIINCGLFIVYFFVYASFKRFALKAQDDIVSREHSHIAARTIREGSDMRYYEYFAGL